MKKNIHVKEYTRKKHGRAKFGGKVSSHDKSMLRIKTNRPISHIVTDTHGTIISESGPDTAQLKANLTSGRFIRGVPTDPQLLNQLRAMVGSKVKVRGDFPITYTLKDVGVTEDGKVEAVIEDQYGTDIVDGKMIIKVKSGRAGYDKNKILQALISGGQNSNDAKKLVDANIDFINRAYGGQKLTPKKIASIMMSVGTYSHGRAKPKYTIVEEGGKPFEYSANSDKELYSVLKKIGHRIKREKDNQTDVKVYNEKNIDVTESQFIDEMIGEIME